MRELKSVTYNSTVYSDENLLYGNNLIEPASLNNSLTYFYGKDSDMFPLLFGTQGQGIINKVKPKMLNSTEYTWNFMTRMKHTSVIVGLVNSSDTKPGLAHGSFDVIFEDNWLIGQYGLITPDKSHTLRIQGEPTQLGPKEYKYTLALSTADASEYVSLENFVPGTAWVMSAPNVAWSKSDGNRSNSMAPGKLTNQYDIVRFSKQIAGNIANKVTPIEFDLEGGGTTTMWMPFEMKLFELDRRLMLEEKLWNSKYNRDEYGMIHLKDPETGEPIPQGAGVKEILKSVGQHDTYSTLTVSKLDSVVNSIFANRVDKTPMELILYTGNGGLEMFNNAFKNTANANSYYEKLGAEEITSGKDGRLSYGKYFGQYKTISGHVITVKEANIFNQGTFAEMDRANGNLVNSHPYESYNFILLDHSMTTNGERNIQFVAEEGRENITGVYRGMSPLPGSWGAFDRLQISTRKDIASYEAMSTGGINILNPYTSYFLEFAA